MNKQKILDKYEHENKKMDEGQRNEDVKADLITLAVIIILSAVAFYVYRNVTVFAMIIGILFIGYGSGEMYRYFKIKMKRYLVVGIIILVFGLLFYVTFLSGVIAGNLERV